MDSEMLSGKAAAPLIPTAHSPCCNVIGFHHLGIAVENMAASVEFYTKIGFQKTALENVLINGGGLEIHFMTCDRGIENGVNILMDTPTIKYPGHTHASFMVPNVATTRQYLEASGIAISGERGKYAVFARDPDRTTLEFERNFGEPIDGPVTGNDIGATQPLDHIGIRISNPDINFVWYAEKLGFVQQILKYVPNPEILKNGSPWISRTMTHCDLNFLINTNQAPAENILLAENVLRPGIVFVAFTVDNVAEASRRLLEDGVTVIAEADIGTSPLRCMASRIVPSSNQNSIFVLDTDLNVLRLVEKSP